MVKWRRHQSGRRVPNFENLGVFWFFPADFMRAGVMEVSRIEASASYIIIILLLVDFVKQNFLKKFSKKCWQNTAEGV